MLRRSLLLIIVLHSGMHGTINAQTTFDRQGHRGCRGLLPENTIPAMKKAIDLGVTLEMDISFSKENIPVVSHDQYISGLIAVKPDGDTISNEEEKTLALYQMPYSSIRQYILGQKLYPRFPMQKKVRTYIPKLSELIDKAEAYAKLNKKPLPKYNIETKTTPAGDNLLHPAPQQFVDLLMKVILKKGIEKRAIIQSFDPRTLEVVHTRYPYMQTALLTESGSLKQNLALLTFLPTIYSPDYTLIDEQTVQQCHAMHLKVIPWTVNEPADIARLKKWGVDGLISDYPDRLLSVK